MTTQVPNGAMKLVQCLEREGVEVVFGYQGGTAMPIFDALMGSKLKVINTRHEQGATHMADGYARATGKPAVVLVTSGPGALNTVTGLFTALMDSVPMVVITGQVVSPLLGKDAFQEADVTGTTYAVTKHSFLVKKAEDLPRVVREAFYIATTGRPGPVLIDLPRDLSVGPCPAPFVDQIDLPGYHVPHRAEPAILEQAARLLNASRRPVLLVGHGAVIANAGPAIMRLATAHNIPMVTTLLGKGACPEDHELHMGMLGMHGTAYANRAVNDCDCIMAIGSRWDDRITGKTSEFCLNARKIHIDIDRAEFGKVVRPEVCLAGDARAVIEDLIPLVGGLDTRDWVAACAKARAEHPLHYPRKGGLRPQWVLDRLDALGARECIVCTDVGQNQMWSAQYLRTTHNRHWISSGGAGTMGFGIPSAIGAAVATGKRTWAVCGDGGFQMTMCELATAARLKVPVKILILNNGQLGMITQWQDLFFAGRFMSSKLDDNPDFLRLASAFGIPGKRIKRPSDIDEVLTWAMQHDAGPCLVEAVVTPDELVIPMIPPGARLDQIMLEPPKRKPQA